LGLGRGGDLPARRGFDPRFERILMVVAERVAEVEQPHPDTSPSMVAWLGGVAGGVGTMLAGHVGYLGLTLAAMAGNLVHPGRMRWRELSAQLSQTGVTAIPVIILVTFLIGLIMAYLLGQQATQYGANIFVVDGVALGMVREFSPLIVAVIVAGRSGAAFTAQLGTMKLTEEIDA